MMTKDQLKVEFDKIIEERGLKFSSNLNPFDMFVLGYELSQQGLMSKLHLAAVIDRFCLNCGNAKMLKGDGSIESLCTC